MKRFPRMLTSSTATAVALFTLILITSVAVANNPIRNTAIGPLHGQSLKGTHIDLMVSCEIVPLAVGTLVSLEPSYFALHGTAGTEQPTKVIAVHFGETVMLRASEYHGQLNPTFWRISAATNSLEHLPLISMIPLHDHKHYEGPLAIGEKRRHQWIAYFQYPSTPFDSLKLSAEWSVCEKGRTVGMVDLKSDYTHSVTLGDADLRANAQTSVERVADRPGLVVFKIEMPEDYSQSWLGWFIQYNQRGVDGQESYRQIFTKTRGKIVSFELPVPPSDVGTYRFFIEATKEISHPSATTRDIPFSLSL